MKKTTTEIKTITQEFIEDIICNKCGKSCRDQMDMNFECASLGASWGYCSRKDTQVHEAHLCEDCYDEFVKTFKIEPEYIDKW